MLKAVLAGGLLMAGAPPANHWYFAVLGLALLYRCANAESWRRRLGLGWLAAVIMFVFNLAWIRQFNDAGWIVLALFEAVFYAAALALTPSTNIANKIGRHSVASLRTFGAIGFIAAMSLAELARLYVPFGGFPLGSVTTSAAGSPFAPLVSVIGEVGMLTVFCALAVGLVEFTRVVHHRRRLVLIPVVLVVVLNVTAQLSSVETASTTPITAVQGGGEQGLDRAEQQPDAVFARHLDIANQARAESFIVWPENAVTVRGPIEDTAEGRSLARLARDKRSHVGAGVVEGEPGRFRNSFIVWSPAGQIVDRYEKVIRVPFGEWVPGRNLIERVADLSQVPSDAYIGTGPAYVDAGGLRASVAISYEGLFSRRVAEGVRKGGDIVLIPTNAASYTDPRVAETQVQAARLRALETGRSVVQAAPTGITAFVDRNGNVVQQSNIGEAFKLDADVATSTGTTPYVQWGDSPLLVLSAVALIATWAAQRGRRERDQDPQGDAQTGSC